MENDVTDSEWTHPVCLGCWELMHGKVQRFNAQNGPSEVCCWCESKTKSGFYMRAHPTGVNCKGKHKTAYDLPVPHEEQVKP